MLARREVKILDWNMDDSGNYRAWLVNARQRDFGNSAVRVFLQDIKIQGSYEKSIHLLGNLALSSAESTEDHPAIDAHLFTKDGDRFGYGVIRYDVDSNNETLNSILEKLNCLEALANNQSANN